MKLENHFKKFHSAISLNPDRKGRIDSACSRLQTFASSDEEISRIAWEIFIQGSHAIGTAVKPLKSNQEFDVDVVLALDVLARPQEQQGPREVIEWLAKRLREDSSFRGKVEARDRCVRIEYAGQFHLDIVPAHCDGDTSRPVQVPDKGNSAWIRSHPKGYIEWCSEVEDASNGKFTRVVKMLKWWRNLKFGKDSAPKSILLTTLVGKHMASGCTSDAEALVVTMQNLSGYLDSRGSVPAIPNPSLVTENLARDWTQDGFDLFKRRFEAATEKARTAYQCEEARKHEAISLWRELFGDAFPKLTPEDAKKMSRAIEAGTAHVARNGIVTPEIPKEVHVTIPRTRYYGNGRG